MLALTFPSPFAEQMERSFDRKSLPLHQLVFRPNYPSKLTWLRVDFPVMWMGLIAAHSVWWSCIKIQ